MRMSFVFGDRGRSGGGPIHVRRISALLFEKPASIPSLFALPDTTGRSGCR
jgi:hypothetical protein